MSAALAAQAGLMLWSYRNPVLLIAGVILGLPLVLSALVAVVFAPLAASGHELVDPLPAARLTQPFGCTDLELEPWSVGCPGHHFHSGIDLGAPAGTPVLAASAGVVMVGKDPRGYGTFVVVRRDDEVSTFYGHLSAVLVESGDYVGAGEVIGETGSSGNSTGPHLHFEVRVGGEPVDPLPMLPARRTVGGGAVPPL